MKNPKVIITVLIVLLGITGFAVVKTIQGKSVKPAPVAEASPTPEELGQVDESVTVAVVLKQGNSVALTIGGLASKYASIAYEMTYDSGGVLKGVNSGSKPIDVSGKDELTRDVYMGTCSKNVCKPDTGVKSVTVALVFTDTAGKESQFQKEFEL